MKFNALVSHTPALHFRNRQFVRVIAGQAGGMRLQAPAGSTTRPTSDRVKEALFSILASCDRIEKATVLDLFAGSGSPGIEALSRGAERATFIDKSRTAIASLQCNLIHTRLAHQAEVLQMDSSHAVERLARHHEQFTLVLLDPPYQAGLHLKTIELMSATAILAPDGLLVAETATRTPLPERIGQCIRSDRRIYGDTALDFFMLEPHHAP